MRTQKCGSCGKTVNSRLFFVGEGRELDALITLQHDKYLKPAFDYTTVISYDEVKPYFADHLDLTNFVFLRDYDFVRDEWREKGNWITQQMIKFAALDQLMEDVTVIQDCDLFAVKEFDWTKRFLVRTGRPRLQECYSIFQSLIPGFTRLTDYYYITELMPVTKGDWGTLKRTIESNTDQHFLSAIWNRIKSVTPTERVWFSEYELLGNWIRTRNPDMPITRMDRFDLSIKHPRHLQDYAGERFISNPSMLLPPDIKEFNGVIENFSAKRLKKA